MGQRWCEASGRSRSIIAVPQRAREWPLLPKPAITVPLSGPVCTAPNIVGVDAFDDLDA